MTPMPHMTLHGPTIGPERQAAEHALAALDAGWQAVQADHVMQRWLAERPDLLASSGRLHVIGAGKAAGWLAKSLISAWQAASQSVRLQGSVSVPADQTDILLPDDPIKLLAGRPAGINRATDTTIEVTERLLDELGQLSADDKVISLITGGASALLCRPIAGISIADLNALTDHLQAQGCPIGELNRIRQQLSTVKGGRLLSRCTAQTWHNVMLSDVASNDPGLIGSGPAVRGGSATPDQLGRLLAPYKLPGNLQLRLESAIGADQSQASPNARGPLQLEHHLLATNTDAVQAMAHCLNEQGFMVENLGSQREGQVDHWVDDFKAAAAKARSHARWAIIAGGECTLTTAPDGRGGRNQHLAMLMASELNAGEVFTSFGTDGEDGPTSMAGAMTSGDFANLSLEQREHRSTAIEQCDSFHYFQKWGGHISASPHRTNVMDLQIMLSC